MKSTEFFKLANSGLSLYVGTSGWAYSVWKPEFYPQKLAAKNFLKHYATKLNTVEVNYTFRRLLSEKAAVSWINDVGPEFRFAPKANQFITHVRQLKDPAALERFLPTLEPLSRQLGPILFQLPPHLKADVVLLSDFLAQLPRNVKSAVEFRHESWFTNQPYQPLKNANPPLASPNRSRSPLLKNGLPSTFIFDFASQATVRLICTSSWRGWNGAWRTG